MWKFEVPVTGEPHTIVGPALFVPRHVAALTPGTVTLWAEVEADAELTEHRFLATGTGMRVAGVDARYVGTAVFGDGSLVWHLWTWPPP